MTFAGIRLTSWTGTFPIATLLPLRTGFPGTTILLGGDLNYPACGVSKFFAGCGTVFEISTSGKEQVLYRFAGGNDGFFPSAGVLALNGTLYGTTSAGGGLPCKKYDGSCGTVFALSLT